MGLHFCHTWYVSYHRGQTFYDTPWLFHIIASAQTDSMVVLYLLLLGDVSVTVVSTTVYQHVTTSCCCCCCVRVLHTHTGHHVLNHSQLQPRHQLITSYSTQSIHLALTDSLTCITSSVHNHCRLGILPQHWRSANITAIHKKNGNKNQPSNYRPISLTSIICKIMESIVRDTINGFFLH